MYHILMITWACFGQDDIYQAFLHLGHKVSTLPLPEEGHKRMDEKYLAELKDRLDRLRPDLVFTFNFFPIIAQACKDKNLKYISWIYDSPYSKMLYPDVLYETNYVFTFDSHICDLLRKKGADTVYYAPLAVNPQRMRAVPITSEDRQRFETDISFVGALYNEEHHFFERLCSKADPYTIGYLEALVMAQTDIYGCDIMEKCLTKDILDKIEECMPYSTPEGFLAPASYIYSNYYLARKVTSTERMLMVELLSERDKMYLYTLDENVSIGNAVNKGIADYMIDMPKIFRCSKINMNVTGKSIHTGVPLRAMDIMGCGGFLLTNFQEDLFLHFEPDVDFVYYTSFEEMLDKADHYLSHDQERERICQSALEKMTREHTFEIRVNEMLRIVNK